MPDVVVGSGADADCLATATVLSNSRPACVVCGMNKERRKERGETIISGAKSFYRTRAKMQRDGMRSQTSCFERGSGGRKGGIHRRKGKRRKTVSSTSSSSDRAWRGGQRGWMLWGGSVSWEVRGTVVCSAVFTQLPCSTTPWCAPYSVPRTAVGVRAGVEGGSQGTTVHSTPASACPACCWGERTYSS